MFHQEESDYNLTTTRFCQSSGSGISNGHDGDGATGRSSCSSVDTARCSDGSGSGAVDARPDGS